MLYICNTNMKKQEQKYYKNLPIDSQGEEDFCIWMEECKSYGLIKDYRRGKSYLLSDVLHNNYVEQLKTKSRPKSQVILFGHGYNLDFEIEWTEDGKKFFCNTFGEKFTKMFICDESNISYIETKPPFDFNNMTRLATLNIKWLWDKYKIFCQIVMNDDLFKKTFVPKQLLNYKNGKPKKFKYKVKTIEEFLK